MKPELINLLARLETHPWRREFPEPHHLQEWKRLCGLSPWRSPFQFSRGSGSFRLSPGGGQKDCDRRCRTLSGKLAGE
jgi:hypothetical protein